MGIGKEKQSDTTEMNMHQNDGTGDLASAATGGSSSPLAREARDVIGEQLRELYGSMVNAPMPDRLKDLLANLAASEKKK